MGDKCEQNNGGGKCRSQLWEMRQSFCGLFGMPK